MKIYYRAAFLCVAIVSYSALIRADEDQIPVGVSSSLTGEGATYGEDIKNVVLFANELIGGGRFKLVIEDDKCNGKDAVTAAKKLVDIDKVKGVIGYGCSGALLGAAPIFERAKIPTIGTETSAAKISQAGKYIFRTQASDRVGVQVLYDYLKQHHHRLGALSVESDFCQGIIDDLTRVAADGAVTIRSENVLSSDTDYRAVLTRLRSYQVDGLFLNAQDEAGAYRMLRQAKELGMRGPFYTFYLGASASFMQLAGADAEGVFAVDVPLIEDFATPEGMALYREFVARYGPMKAWNYGFATTFEGFRALTEALTRSNDPQRYLSERTFSGVFGPYSFDANGDIVGLSLVLKRNQNGAPKVVR